MNRRAFLGGTTLAGSLALSGCLGRVGFEEESAWRNPPLVEDRPDGVYVPAGVDEMGTYGTATAGPYAVSLTYTFPHRFWIVADGTSRVAVTTENTHHLMVTAWDREADLIVPVDMTVDVLRDDEIVTSFVPWPMLSQQMGFHYGDNVSLPGEGAYTARIRAGPLTARGTGQFADRFTEVATLAVDFEYDRADITDLGFDPVPEERRGDRDALPLMQHGGSGQDDADGPGPPPSSSTPAVADLPGEHLGTDRTGDMDVTVLLTERDRLAPTDGAYLAVVPRTPYNHVMIPLTSFAGTLSCDGEDTDLEFRETFDPEYGHHYGAVLETPPADCSLTLTVASPPQVARHDGYETAFFTFDPVSLSM
jgi:hypothetical protein